MSESGNQQTAINPRGGQNLAVALEHSFDFLGGKLLLVILDNLCWTHFGLIGVFAELAQGAALAQEIPALVQLDLYLGETRLVVIGEAALCVEELFFLDQLVDVAEDGLVGFLVGHGNFPFLKDKGPTHGRPRSFHLFSQTAPGTPSAGLPFDAGGWLKSTE